MCNSLWDYLANKTHWGLAGFWAICAAAGYKSGDWAILISAASFGAVAYGVYLQAGILTYSRRQVQESFLVSLLSNLKDIETTLNMMNFPGEAKGEGWTAIKDMFNECKYDPRTIQDQMSKGGGIAWDVLVNYLRAADYILEWINSGDRIQYSHEYERLVSTYLPLGFKTLFKDTTILDQDDLVSLRSLKGHINGLHSHNA